MVLIICLITYDVCYKLRKQDFFSQTYPGSLGQSISRVHIGTMAVKDNRLVAGGFKGEVLYKTRIRFLDIN